MEVELLKELIATLEVLSRVHPLANVRRDAEKRLKELNSLDIKFGVFKKDSALLCAVKPD